MILKSLAHSHSEVERKDEIVWFMTASVVYNADRTKQCLIHEHRCSLCQREQHLHPRRESSFVNAGTSFPTSLIDSLPVVLFVK